MRKEKKWNVCILGTGTAGMAAAYALANYRLSNGEKVNVILVEPYATLGGTAVNAWVQTWIEGINPPYLEKILMEYGYKPEEIRKSILPARFGGGGNLLLNHEKLAEQYRRDMDAAQNVTVLTGHWFGDIKSVTCEGGKQKIHVITVKDKDGNCMDIEADFFIDSSGDGVLCRAAGVDYYIGEDPYSRFNEDLMPKNDQYDETSLNEPSLFYRVLPPEKSQSDNEFLGSIETVYEKDGKVVKPDYIDSDGYANQRFCNPMTGLGMTGYECLGKPEWAYKTAVNRFLEHWKFVKTTLQQRYNDGMSGSYRGYPVNQRLWNYTGEFAPMLGIRESYRIKCEYMLRQNDLTELIDPNNLKDYIACGSHTIDFHITQNIDRRKVTLFNKSIKPSGIPYRCMIPLGVKNVLIACRAYGASHIALAARRLNKDMAQLGWAAGFAVRECMEGNLDDVRLVDVTQIQKKSGFKENVQRLMDKYK